MNGLGYSERVRSQKGLRWGCDRAALAAAPDLVRDGIYFVERALETSAPVAARITWRIVRAAVRAADRPATDRLEWRARCHRVNGLTERVTWPGGQATRHTVHTRERARCLLMGRDHPIAGPSGRLP